MLTHQNQLLTLVFIALAGISCKKVEGANSGSNLLNAAPDAVCSNFYSKISLAFNNPASACRLTGTNEKICAENRIDSQWASQGTRISLFTKAYIDGNCKRLYMQTSLTRSFSSLKERSDHLYEVKEDQYHVSFNPQLYSQLPALNRGFELESRETTYFTDIKGTWSEYSHNGDSKAHWSNEGIVTRYPATINQFPPTTSDEEYLGLPPPPKKKKSRKD